MPNTFLPSTLNMALYIKIDSLFLIHTPQLPVRVSLSRFIYKFKLKPLSSSLHSSINSIKHLDGYSFVVFMREN